MAGLLLGTWLQARRQERHETTQRRRVELRDIYTAYAAAAYEAAEDIRDIGQDLADRAKIRGPSKKWGASFQSFRRLKAAGILVEFEGSTEVIDASCAVEEAIGNYAIAVADARGAPSEEWDKVKDQIDAFMNEARKTLGT
ncbi:hypothetical protein [Streptomyces hokutonensis]|uniref:Uncharacterized protein n=1 Tax=Streptomyces hokutonensis TaxID=1306990 RepID=A0ABW6M7M2_9ACTN